MLVRLSSRAALLLMSVLLVLGLVASCASADRGFDSIISFGGKGKPDECCTEELPSCCGRTCRTRADALSGPACPSKRACCTPPDEEPTFPDCCDVYSRCCGDRCIPSYRNVATAVYYDCTPVEGGCCGVP
eukprot:jgi/Ulvmu1/1310/UM011_0037.1